MLAKDFVELHGGTLTLESAPGRGSAFTFTLPVDPGGGGTRQRDCGKAARSGIRRAQPEGAHRRGQRGHAEFPAHKPRRTVRNIHGTRRQRRLGADPKHLPRPGGQRRDDARHGRLRTVPPQQSRAAHLPHPVPAAHGQGRRGEPRRGDIRQAQTGISPSHSASRRCARGSTRSSSSASNCANDTARSCSPTLRKSRSNRKTTSSSTRWSRPSNRISTTRNSAYRSCARFRATPTSRFTARSRRSPGSRSTNSSAPCGSNGRRNTSRKATPASRRSCIA